MDEEMIINISRVAQINRDDARKIVNDSGLSAWEIFKFYAALCRFPTAEESEVIKLFGVNNVNYFFGRVNKK